MRNMAPRWWVSSEVRLLLYGYEVCQLKCVDSHPHPIYVPPPFPSKWCITCDTHANIKHRREHGPWLSRAHVVQDHSSHSRSFSTSRHAHRPSLQFSCVAGQFDKWAFGLALSHQFQASDQASLHLTSKSSLFTTSVRQAHQAHQAHTSPHKRSEARG